jgi:PAS domain S-box-containing protein
MTYESSATIQIPELYYTALFEAISGNNVLVRTDAPLFTILAASPSYKQQTGSTEETLIGKGIFEAFPGNTDPVDTGAKNLRFSLEYVLKNKKVHNLPVQRYDIAGEDGRFSERYWKASNKPVLGPDGQVAFIIHTADDITAQVKAREREVQIEGIEKAFNLFMHAPMVVGLVSGDDYLLELANDEALKFWGKSGKEIIGKPIVESIPELESHGSLQSLTKFVHLVSLS